MQNFKVIPKGLFVSHCKIQNFKVVPKRPYVLFQGNIKFWKLHPHSYSFFYNEIQNFESCTQTAICISLKEIQNLTIYHQLIFVSQKQKKLKIWFQVILFRLFTMKNKITNIIELWITHYSQQRLWKYRL